MTDEFYFPTPSSGAGAPKVDDGLGIARFENILIVEHPDWATEKDSFGKADDGRRHHFVFTMLDEKHEEMIGDDGDPIEIEKKTSMATGKRSGFRAVMESLLTPQEFAAWSASTAEQPWTGGAAVRGRVFNIKVSHSPGGWPQVEDVISVAKAPK